MKALIVEDDPHKLTEVRRELTRLGVADVHVAMSLQEASDILDQSVFDVVILDMSIPSHGGDSKVSDVYSQPVGGLDILLYLSTDDRPERVIVLTQYPTIEYDREHVPLKRIVDRLHRDEVANLKAVSLFADDGLWKVALDNFLKDAG